MKKVLALILILTAFFLWSPVWTTALAPVGHALASLPAVEQFTTSKDMKEYDYTDPDFQMLMILTSYFYSRVTGDPVGFNSGFSVLRVTGDLALEVQQKCSCAGYTVPNQKVVVVLVDKHSVISEELRVTSHELVHVLQTVNGKLPLMSKTQAEYQAEIISRFVMSVWAEVKLYGSLDSRDASPLARERFHESLGIWE